MESSKNRKITYINVDFQEIAKELRWLDASSDRRNAWERFSPSNADIDKLFKKYKCVEFTENFFDSEPGYDNAEEFLMYMDYITLQGANDAVTGTGFYEAVKAVADTSRQKFSTEDHTLREYRKAYNKIHKQIQDYNRERIKSCNWIEVHAEWNWDGDQEVVDRLAKEEMAMIKSAPVHKRDRLWIRKEEEENEIKVYYYGRDWLYVDYVWSFVPRKTTEATD